MNGYFDSIGDLWIEVNATQMPKSVVNSGVLLDGQVAITQINLTDYIRKAVRPNWLHAAMTPTSAEVTIIGNTPTTGGNLTAEDYDRWLNTIPQPIEPA
jgi:hypothetical protein